jgi:hypothetical protein
MMRQSSVSLRLGGAVDDAPRTRLEIRVDGEPLAWYPLSQTDEALRHVDAMLRHPLNRAVVQLWQVRPGSTEAVIVTTKRRAPRDTSSAAGARRRDGLTRR